MDIQKHAREIASFLHRGDFKETDGGLLIHGCIRGRGGYTHWIAGQEDDARTDHNLIPVQGILHFLDVTLGNTPKEPGWYLAPFSGAVAPAANWTAANFAANASEIVSTEEGYSNPTRPQWSGGAAAAGVKGNNAAPAVFNIVCTSSLNIAGIGMLSSNARGGQEGVLVSASRYSSVRVVNNGDAFNVIYEIELTDS